MVYRKYKEIKQWGKMNTLIFKQMMQARNKRNAFVVPIPSELKKIGVQIHDPTKPEFFQQPELFEVDHPAFRKPSIKEHPLYQDQKAFLFEGTEPFSDGVDQACALIGSIPSQPFTSDLLQHRMVWPDDLDDRVKDGILVGERFDPTLEKLEKRFDPILFWVQGQRMYGTPVEKRSLDYGRPLTTLISADLFGTKLPAVFRHEAPVLIQRTSPVKQVATNEEVEETKSQKTVDIYPISPLIDLQKTNIYNKTAVIPRANAPSLHVDSVFISAPYNQKYPWTTDQNAANAIMFAFTSALSEAQRNGNVDQLKKPVVAKAIQLSRGVVDLAVVQLNNLNLNNEDGVKNMVWLEKALPLYTPSKHDENLTKLDDVNLDTFKKVANLLLY